MIIAIVGPTASGKSELALNLAKKYGGEIICGDSRTVYRGMDIGTAKPSRDDQLEVRHHVLDVINPDQHLGVASFKRLAAAAETEILGRGNIPLLVGGSGMYVDAVMYDYIFPGASDPVMRKRMASIGTERLAEELALADPAAYDRIDLRNRRRLIRALETVGQVSSRRKVIREDSLMIGIALNKELARERITIRVNKMLEEGFIDEVRTIGDRYGWDGPAMNVIGYRAFRDVIAGSKSTEDAVADFIRGDLLLYKKQVTWFKRNPQIHWIDGEVQGESEHLVEAFLKYT
jgi:tRNA dimethylallyltransferase